MSRPTLLDRRFFLMSATALTFAATGNRVAAAELPKPDRGGVPENKLYDYGVMGPPATPEIVANANAALTTPMPEGPFRPEWGSIASNYHTPPWFAEAQFGIFIHWGLYSAAARRNEWYQKHMYARAESDWHAQHFGPQETFGYKDFIPLFTAAKFDADEWAELFKAAGARYVIPAAQHHDNYALWDSQVTRYNTKNMGPKRDLIGELAQAVRKQDMKYGLSNHGVENFTFINPSPEIDARLKALKADLYDPEWADFYNVADRSPAAMTRFLTDWTARNFELIDKYQPDILWFDNGANLRVLDPLKLRIAAYYYNRARQWDKDVSLSTKFVAYAPANDDQKQIGSIIDFEKVGPRSPAAIRPGPWMVDDNLGSTWGYTEGMTVASAPDILRRLIDTVSKGGSYLLNISPMADGTIPQTQKDSLLGIGQWLKVNGAAIYNSRPWTQFGEGDNIRFTQNGNSLYVSVIKPAGKVSVTALKRASNPRITSVKRLDTGKSVTFRQTQDALEFNSTTGATPAVFEIRFA
ncbi:MAG: alpha-L-fucosidase [Asticcacaulis sp.]